MRFIFTKFNVSYDIVEPVTIGFGLLLALILMMFGSSSVFKKEGDSLQKLLLKGLILPGCFAALIGIMMLLVWITM